MAMGLVMDWSRRLRQRDLATLPASPDPALALMTNAVHRLDTTLENHHTEMMDAKRDEARRKANPSFSDCFREATSNYLCALLDKATPVDLPQVHRDLAKNTGANKSNDHTTLITAVDSRTMSPDSLVDEYTKPVVTTAVINLFRTYDLQATDTLGSGLSPFIIVNATSHKAKDVTKTTRLQHAMESTQSGMTLSEAETLSTFEGYLPKDAHTVYDVLAGYSCLIHVFFGPTHVLAMALRNGAKQMEGVLRNLGREMAAAEAAVIGNRVLYRVQQLVMNYLRRVKEAGASIATPPDFASLVDVVRDKTFGQLPQLPGDWVTVDHDTSGEEGSRKRGAPPLQGGQSS